MEIQDNDEEMAREFGDAYALNTQEKQYRFSFLESILKFRNVIVHPVSWDSLPVRTKAYDEHEESGESGSGF